MADKKNNTRNKSGKPGDTDADVQDELARESTEGADSIGDVGSNRTVTGSSSWETLPGKAVGGGGASKPGKQSGKPPATPSPKKKAR
jgi:hypothetical protein